MFKIFKAMRQADHIQMSREYRFVGLCFTDFQVKENSQMLQNWDPKVKLRTLKKKYFKLLLTRNIQVLIWSMGRTIRELQIIFWLL
jgi:hypothetical protein